MSWCYEGIKYLIVIVGFALAYLELQLYFRYGKYPKKIFFAIIGIYWALYYLYSILRPMFGWEFLPHQTFVRPGILFTLSIIFAQSINKWRFLKDV